MGETQNTAKSGGRADEFALPPFRSFLFSPGVRPDLMEKAARSGADALIFDLEDSVPPDRKDEARANVGEALSKPGDPPAFVRVNHPSTGGLQADIEALRPARLAGVILSKAETVEDVRAADALLAAFEARNGLTAGQTALVLLIEDCIGLRNAYDMVLAASRVRATAFSSAEEGDFMVDIGGEWTPEGEAMLYARSKLVCDSRAAGIEFLYDGVFMNLSDEEALRRECRLARRLGYIGKMGIHPRQIPILHEVFTPSEEEIGYSQGLVEAFRAAEAEGRAAIKYEGKMVDYANFKRAQRVLALAGGIAGSK